jgi:hypothetical protein
MYFLEGRKNLDHMYYNLSIYSYQWQEQSLTLYWTRLTMFLFLPKVAICTEYVVKSWGKKYFWIIQYTCMFSNIIQQNTVSTTVQEPKNLWKNNLLIRIMVNNVYRWFVKFPFDLYTRRYPKTNVIQSYYHWFLTRCYIHVYFDKSSINICSYGLRGQSWLWSYGN